MNFGSWGLSSDEDFGLAIDLDHGSGAEREMLCADAARLDFFGELIESLSHVLHYHFFENKDLGDTFGITLIKHSINQCTGSTRMGAISSIWLYSIVA
jgi:hypothetical protein